MRKGKYIYITSIQLFMTVESHNSVNEISDCFEKYFFEYLNTLVNHCTPVKRNVEIVKNIYHRR